MLTEIDELLQDICYQHSMALVFAQPFEHNVEADKKNAFYLWSDIQQDGQMLETADGGYKLTTHLKLNFCDLMPFEEEGPTVNIKKNILVQKAFKFFKNFCTEGEERALFTLMQNATWQVVYNQQDANQMMVQVNCYLTEYTTESNC